MINTIYGRYRVAYCEPHANGERANFGVVAWSEDGDGLRVISRATVSDWPRFEAFTGWSRDDAQRWFHGHTTPEGLERYERAEQGGSSAIAMSCLRFTEPRATAIMVNGEPRDPMPDLVRHFLGESDDDAHGD